MARWYEGFFGRLGDEHLTVSKAFRKDLAGKFGIPIDKISVLYDRAVAGKFRVLTLEEKHQLYGRTGLEAVFTQEVLVGNVDNDKMHVRAKPTRPALLLTSTSYTPDEDIGLLITALQKYAIKAYRNAAMPSIRLIVTGAGPLKKQFLKKFEEFNCNLSYAKAKIEAKWLEIDDYPKMVAAADLGICMHMSSSNLDLPMKVVDMFSSRLPCFAFRYPTIGELVETTENGSSTPNGALFSTSDELAKLLTNQFQNGLEAGLEGLEEYRNNLDKFMGETWDDHWQEVLLHSKERGCLLARGDASIIKK